MGKLRVLFFLLLISFGVSAQKIQKVNTYGYEYNRFIVDTLFALPGDTFTVPAALQSYPFLAKKGTTLYLWNTSTLVWASVSGGGGTTYTFPNGLTESGGTVKLGGTLVDATTTIDINGNDLVFVDAGATRLSMIAGTTDLFSPSEGSNLSLNDNYGQLSGFDSLILRGGQSLNNGRIRLKDSIHIYPPLGNLYIDSLNYTLSTTGKKIMLRDTATGLVQNIDPALLGGGGGSGMAIADLITSATAGSMLYAGTGGRLQQSNSRFYYDSANGRLGISSDGLTPFSGSYKPESPLHIIESQSGQPRGITIDNIANITNGAGALFRKSRGTFSSPTKVLAGDNLGYLAFNGYNGSAWSPIASGHTAVFQAESYSDFSTNYATGFKFELTDSSNTIQPRMRISPSGRVSIGNFTPNTGAKLDVDGNTYTRGIFYQISSAAANSNYYLQTNGQQNVSTTDLNPGIAFYKNGANVWGADLGYNSTTSRYRTRLFSSASGDIVLSSANNPTAQSDFTDWLVVNGTSGNVGIGTNTPASILHTVGTVRHASLGTASGDTTTNKPVGINSSGDIIPMTYWPGGGGGTGGGDSVVSYQKNAGGDSIILTMYDGRRFAVKDSIGSGSGGTPAGNYGNLQINRNGAFATPASDSLDFESATGLTVKGNISNGGWQILNNGYIYPFNTSSIIYGGGSGGGSFAANIYQYKWTFGSSSTPTALVHISAGTASGNTAPLKFTSGTNLTTPESGAIEFDGTNFYSTNSTAERRTIVAAGVGTATASANDLTLPKNGNVFHITGATQLNAIVTSGWPAGSEITLIFDSTPTVKNNTAGGGGTAVLLLAGGADFSATANDVLKLVYDGVAWLEVSRSVN